MRSNRRCIRVLCWLGWLLITVDAGFCQLQPVTRARRFRDFPTTQQFHGSLRNITAQGFHPSGRLSKSQFIGSIEVIRQFGPQFWFTSRIRTIVDPVNKLEIRKNFNAEPLDRWETKRHFELDLRELYFDLGLGLFDLRVGRQQVVWGDADGLRVLDVVNPRDFREFLLEDFSESRIPLWMIRGNMYAGPYTFDILWIPDFEPDRLAQPGTEFMAVSPLGPGSIPLGVAKTEASDWKDRPDYGIRMSRSFADWEFTLNFFDFWEDTPTPEGPLFGHRRSNLIGGKISTRIARMGYRGEMTITQNKSLFARRASDNLLRRTVMYFMIGLDYDAKNRWRFADFGTFQYFQELILDYDTRIVQDQARHTFSAGLHKTFLRGILTARIFTLYNMNDIDFLIRPQISSPVHDRVTISFGADVFGGDGSGFFGQFGSRDRFVLTANYHF